MDIKNKIHRFIGGALTALVAIAIAFGLLVACDGDNKQYIPSVEAAEETHIVEYESKQFKSYGTESMFFAIYAKNDEGQTMFCIAVVDSDTNSLECK